MSSISYIARLYIAARYARTGYLKKRYLKLCREHCCSRLRAPVFATGFRPVEMSSRFFPVPVPDIPNRRKLCAKVAVLHYSGQSISTSYNRARGKQFSVPSLVVDATVRESNVAEGCVPGEGGEKTKKADEAIGIK